MARIETSTPESIVVGTWNAESKTIVPAATGKLYAHMAKSPQANVKLALRTNADRDAARAFLARVDKALAAWTEPVAVAPTAPTAPATSASEALLATLIAKLGITPEQLAALAGVDAPAKPAPAKPVATPAAMLAGLTAQRTTANGTTRK